MKIIIDNKIPFIKDVFEPYAEVIYKLGDKIEAKDVVDTEVLIIRTRTRCNKKLLQGSKIKLILSATIGFDHIDTEYLAQNNIIWMNCPGCNSFSVQQYIASALIILARKRGLNLANLTLGIIGYGHIGTKVKIIAEKLNMKVLVNDLPKEKDGSIEQVFVNLSEIKLYADIITIHTPLIYEGIYKTYHLVDNQFLKEIKSSAIIINTARGEIVNNQHLKKALQNNDLAGAVLDVWENEPLIDKELIDKSDLSTSHIAGYAIDGKSTGTQMVVIALAQFFDLPLLDWQPKGLPKLEINFDNLSLENAILKTYDIRNDSQLLKDNLSSFEKLRNNYSVRRDFSYFKNILKI